MIHLKSPAEIQAMRPAGALVAQALAAVRAAIAPGVTTLDLDQVAARVIRDGGGRPAFFGYHPRWAPTAYPGVLCTSVNERIVHAIPDDVPLVVGDLISVDCGAFVDQWCGDAAFSAIVGAEGILDPTDGAIRSGRELLDQQLIAATEEALAAGTSAARVGGRMGDIGAAIYDVVHRAGFGVLEDHGGHGIGRSMHEDPHVPNEGRRGRGQKRPRTTKPPPSRCGRRFAGI